MQWKRPSGGDEEAVPQTAILSSATQVGAVCFNKRPVKEGGAYAQKTNICIYVCLCIFVGAYIYVHNVHVTYVYVYSS